MENKRIKFLRKRLKDIKIAHFNFLYDEKISPYSDDYVAGIEFVIDQLRGNNNKPVDKIKLSVEEFKQGVDWCLEELSWIDSINDMNNIIERIEHGK